jgi:predicted transport protein
LIFESLNSTGLELTQADLIRNYILMGLEKSEQEELYNNYWSEMEKDFRQSAFTDEFDFFVRSYLIMKENKIPKIKEIYQAFKLFSKKFDSIKKLVVDLHQFSKYYVNFSLEKEPDNDIRSAFADINELKVDVSYPFILSVYHDYANGIITKEQFIEILRLIESYVFRRAICGVPTNSLNKTFSTLYKKIDRENYLESLKAIIVLQDSYRRIPDDEEFKKELQIKDIYHFRNRNYILKKLENYDRKEFVDVESYTIEHIMPQNPDLSEQWKQDLGEKWKEIQKTYLHTIGNLTLTGYNSELSDKPFKEKRDMKGGFRDSPIRMNRGLAQLESWNETEIKKRAEEIINLAKEVWSFPSVEAETLEKYKTEEEEEPKQKYTIEDHEYLKEGEQMRPLFDELRKRILNIDSSVKEEPQKLYIAYKSSTNFVDIIPQKKALRLSLNIPFEKIKDPQEKCRDVSGKGKWGNGDTEVKISHFEELDYVLNLIKQAFKNVEEENGN